MIVEASSAQCPRNVLLSAGEPAVWRVGGTYSRVLGMGVRSVACGWAQGQTFLVDKGC
jgi:hypothetical protein